MISALIGQCKGWTIRKVMVGEVWGGGGGGGGPRKLLMKKFIYSYGFWPNKICTRRIQGGSVQVTLLQINYEVNYKSRLEIKRDLKQL